MMMSSVALLTSFGANSLLDCAFIALVDHVEPSRMRHRAYRLPPPTGVNGREAATAASFCAPAGK